MKNQHIPSSKKWTGALTGILGTAVVGLGVMAGVNAYQSTQKDTSGTQVAQMNGQVSRTHVFQGPNGAMKLFYSHPVRRDISAVDEDADGRLDRIVAYSSLLPGSKTLRFDHDDAPRENQGIVKKADSLYALARSFSE